ncbi:hypothetical protein FHG87_022175 [Trinorchestia longiramus]|nr:hypothetical protein FHG87_022175 [Trinorchestia longiramus]
MGVGVMQTKNAVFLEQSAYTKALLSRIGKDKANSVATPVDVNTDLVTTSDEVEVCDEDLYQSAVGNVDCDSWIIVLGATQHMCNKKSEFSSYSDLSSPVRVGIGDGRALKGVGVGDVRLKTTLPNMQSETKGYRLYDFNAKRILLSRDVVFNESQFMSFEKEPSKEIEIVPWYFPQEEKHEDSEGELELRRLTRVQLELLENGCA